MRMNRSSQSQGGFSLVEVTFAMAVAAVALISIIGMLPQAMEMSRDSADLTAIGTIMEDAHDRLEGLPLEAGVPAVSPLYYDQQGRNIENLADIENPILDRAFFRVELELSDLAGEAKPENIDDLKAVTMKVYWPLLDDGTPLPPGTANVNISYYVNALTGPDWSLIEPGFQPKVEF